MERSTETLLRWTCITWLWVFAVLAGLGAGQMVRKWPEPTGWHAPSQLAFGRASRGTWGSYNQPWLSKCDCLPADIVDIGCFEFVKASHG